ncbi:cation-translocating P-type ATPase [Saccharopolyspora thermophila]|uniref:cation-translocating P-type ATPase n=1 Tax=Saccharopolyspora thermophila TaxID=89367 RepID=UPI001E2BD0CB|nr:cation-translocating P-type ATPase [Saccharopolyspora subtropica]
MTTTPAGRRVWRGRRRSHLEVRGIHRPGTEDAARDLEQRLLAVEGVHSAEVNGVLGRVVVGHDPKRLGIAALAEVIAAVEAEYGLTDEGISEHGETHPGNADALLRDVGALAVSLFGLGYATLGALLPVRVVSPLVPAVLSLVDSVPWLRAGVESTLGRSRANMVLAVGGSAAHGLGGAPLSVLADLGNRFCATREAIARHQAWLQWEQSATHRCAPVAAEARPTRLPDGPVERVAGTLGGLALAGYGSVLATTRSPQRALAALVAGVPRAARSGREAFAAQLTATFSGRGGLVLRPEAVRRLDRVDTVVFDSSVLLTGRRVLDSVRPLDDSDPVECFSRAGHLLDLRDPTAPRSSGPWSIRPAGDLPEASVEPGAIALLLFRHDEPVAVVSVVEELDPLAEALVAAASPSAFVAAAGEHLDERLGVDEVVPGDRLAQEVRRMQHEGAVVAVVSRTAHAALAAADVGIGLSEQDSDPWGADLLCPSADLVHLALLALAEARTASRRGALLSVAGSCLGAVLAVFGPARGAPARAALPLHAATFSALVLGTWSGLRVAKRGPPVPRERTPWHAMPAATVLAAFGSTERGRRLPEPRRRRPRAAGRAPLGVVAATVEGLVNPITPVLAAGAVASAAMGSLLDAVLIVGVLVVSAFVDGLQRVVTDRELAKLLDAEQLPARRRLDGGTEVVPADRLVPGDVVEVRAGDGVPADCRLLEVDGLEVDESALTGESLAVTKQMAATAAPVVADRACMLYQGTYVASGAGTAIVVATGAGTELGRTAQENPGRPGATGGVEARMRELTRQVLPLSAGAGVALFVVDLLRAVPLGQTLSRSVGLAVAAVPEGLPFVATLAELAAARRLSRRGVLVRAPATVEALGRVDALCFDKTGTLTQGRIALRRVSDGRTAQSTSDLDAAHREVVAAAVRASPRPDGEPLPHLTDRAVLDGARELGLPPAPPVLAELRFEPSRGFHAVRTHGLLSVKGAPEVVLDRCAFADPRERARVETEVERLALLGYRLLAVAERPDEPGTEVTESDVDGMRFVGLLGLADPVHPTAAEAVARLRRSGVDAIMITGDHPSTAEAIAAELGMLGDRQVLAGAELDELDDEQLAGELPKISVFARVSPAQKARIVQRLQAVGRVVAMTGDGANDVPAIGLAQVGVAFGSRATPAAREAADLVVSDDRIETLTDGIVEGRGMWMSVHDALSMLLGGNLGEIGYALGTGLLGRGAALNTRQLLVVNMFTDVLPAIAIAVRPPPDATPEKLLGEGPEASLGTALARDVYVRAAATAGAAGLAWALARPVSTTAQARTTGLVALVAAQLAQTLAVRGRTPLVLAAGFGSLLALAALVQTPVVSRFFGSSPLLPHQWGIALAAAVAAALVTALRR